MERVGVVAAHVCGFDLERFHQSIMNQEVHGVAVDGVRREGFAKLLGECENVIGGR